MLNSSFRLLPESIRSNPGNRASQSIPLSSQTLWNSVEDKRSCDRNKTKAAITCDSGEVNWALQVRDKLNFPPRPGPLRAPREKAELKCLWMILQLMIVSPSSLQKLQRGNCMMKADADRKERTTISWQMLQIMSIINIWKLRWTYLWGSETSVLSKTNSREKQLTFLHS